MGFFEKLLRGMAGGHHGKHYGGGYSDGTARNHHGWGNNFPANPIPQTGVGMGVTKACAQCGVQVPSDARFCSQCGESLGPGRCTGCNSELIAGMKFCPECGKALDKS